MTTRPERHDFYVYALISEGVVFYIGKGRDRRLLSHGQPSNTLQTAEVIRAIQASGQEWQAVKLADGLDEAEALRRERRFLGLVDARPLANKVGNPWLAYLRRTKTKTCRTCGALFRPFRSDAVTCSDRCRQRLSRQRRHEPDSLWRPERYV